jgi:hypothetical protein
MTKINARFYIKQDSTFIKKIMDSKELSGAEKSLLIKGLYDSKKIGKTTFNNLNAILLEENGWK